MDVSIIIINYNTFQFTSKCIRSIYQHTKGLQFEIILVDNASRECDPLLFKQEFPGIVLIKNVENVGFAKGNNIGIGEAKGDVILLLNSDTELLNEAVSIAFKGLIQNETLAAVSVKLQNADGTVQYQCQRFPSVSLALLELLRLHKLLPQKTRAKVLLSTYFDHNSYVEPDSIWGTFFMFKRKILQHLPGKKLNDDYFMYFEDIQWCMDIKNLGYSIGYVPEGIVIHYMGKSNAPKNELMKKGLSSFLGKNYNPVKAFLLNALLYRNQN